MNLLKIEGKNPPATDAGHLGIVMLLSSGVEDDMNWFEYRPGFFAPVLRVEWELDTMQVVLPVDTAELLIERGYARRMTNSEAREYNGRQGATEPVPPPRSPKKGDD